MKYYKQQHSTINKLKKKIFMNFPSFLERHFSLFYYLGNEFSQICLYKLNIFSINRIKID